MSWTVHPRSPPLKTNCWQKISSKRATAFTLATRITLINFILPNYSIKFSTHILYPVRPSHMRLCVSSSFSFNFNFRFRLKFTFRNRFNFCVCLLLHLFLLNMFTYYIILTINVFSMPLPPPLLLFCYYNYLIFIIIIIILIYNSLIRYDHDFYYNCDC